MTIGRVALPPLVAGPASASSAADGQAWLDLLGGLDDLRSVAARLRRVLGNHTPTDRTASPSRAEGVTDAVMALARAVDEVLATESESTEVGAALAQFGKDLRKVVRRTFATEESTEIDLKTDVGLTFRLGEDAVTLLDSSLGAERSLVAALKRDQRAVHGALVAVPRGGDESFLDQIDRFVTWLHTKAREKIDLVL